MSRGKPKKTRETEIGKGRKNMIMKNAETNQKRKEKKKINKSSLDMIEIAVKKQFYHFMVKL